MSAGFMRIGVTALDAPAGGLPFVLAVEGGDVGLTHPASRAKTSDARNGRGRCKEMLSW